MPRRPAPVQPSLLEWAPPAPYAEGDVRAATLAGRVSRAVAQTLRECTLDRAEVARRMGAFLGEPVSLAALNACASQAREDHSISAVRLLALMHATGDTRPLELLAQPFELAVIPRRLLPMIELAEVHEQMETLRRRKDHLRRTATGGVA